jgi:hypothetical protein
MVIGGGASFRLHTSNGQNFLYGVIFGRRGWRGCTSEEVRQSFLVGSCCGEQTGALLEHEVCCQWPTFPGPQGLSRFDGGRR